MSVAQSHSIVNDEIVGTREPKFDPKKQYVYLNLPLYI